MIKSNHEIEWHPEALTAIECENYSEGIEIYEKHLRSHTEDISIFFYIGLLHLLNGDEAMAHMTWFFAIEKFDEVDSHKLSLLIDILEKEANVQNEKENLESSWLIRQHIREIYPLKIENIIKLIVTTKKLNRFTINLLKEWQFLDALALHKEEFNLSDETVTEFLDIILDYHTQESLNIVSSLATLIQDKKFFCNSILDKAIKIKPSNPYFSGKASKICLDFFPDNLDLWRIVYSFYAITNKYQEAINIAMSFYDKCFDIEWKLLAIYSIIREKTRGGDWLHLKPTFEEYKTLMSLISKQKISGDGGIAESLISPIIPCMLQYWQDNAVENREFQNKISNKFYNYTIKNFIKKKDDNKHCNLKVLHTESYLNHCKSIDFNKKIKIGFLTAKLSLHSIGWLSRWIFKYYDKDKFDFYIYLTNQNSNDFFTKKWFESQVKECKYFAEKDFIQVAKSIYNDEIDILIDLDSTTSSNSCIILAVKPAPIQVTWLGFDGSGLPSVDYFIADQFLLPKDAESYYCEKVWRLPQTYLALDGFEVDIPTLFRKDLDIPENAIVYLTSQTGQKRHPDTIKLQLKVIKSVPNSFLLIKGWGESSIIRDLFLKIAIEEKIDTDRLRFIPLDENEFVHRANLQIADIILDTYPYSGATTTLEAIWMGIPIVTKVGQQCAARNSYTFLAQLGVKEGVAFTDEEYVYWGTRLGLEPKLRQSIYFQMHQSRQTAPVWNTKAFVKDMENAWLKMLQIYAQNSISPNEH